MDGEFFTKKNILNTIQTINGNKEILRNIALAISICVLFFSTFNVAKKLYAYYHDNMQYEKIREQLPLKNSADRFNKVFENGPTPSEYNPQGLDSNNNSQQDNLIPFKVESGDVRDLDLNGNLTEYSNLKSINDDIAGWIFMPGFKKALDYPVMQASNNEYYIYKDFYKNYSYAGSVFMDYRNNPFQVDKHIIIYGHAMNDLSMFGNLKEFSEKTEDYTQLTKIYLDLMNTRLEYQVFSTYLEEASYDNRQIVFSSDIEFEDYFKRICSKSIFDYGIDIKSTDKILTLSTCNNTQISNGRSIIHAKLIKQIIYNKVSETQYSKSPSKQPVSANVYLTRLSLKYGNENNKIEAVLDPLFDTKLKEFSTIIPPATDTIFLDVQTADPQAKVYMTINGISTNIKSIQMVYGENIIKIKIISRDGLFSRTYVIKVMRISDNQIENAP